MVVKLKPTWDYSSKPGNDKTGWKRGAKGIDGAFDLDGKEYLKTFDPKADARIYGPTTRSPRADGAQTIMCNAADPGTITNRDDDGTSSGLTGLIGEHRQTLLTRPPQDWWSHKRLAQQNQRSLPKRPCGRMGAKRFRCAQGHGQRRPKRLRESHGGIATEGI